MAKQKLKYKVMVGREVVFRTDSMAEAFIYQDTYNKTSMGDGCIYKGRARVVEAYLDL